MRETDDRANEAEGIREDEYRERQAEQRRALGPEYESEDTFTLCVSCRAAEGTMERADGEYVCSNCYADAAAHAFDRATELNQGDRNDAR